MIDNVINDYNISNLIIIEDGITCLEDVEEALTKFALINSETCERIIGNLLLLDYSKIVEQLNWIRDITSKYFVDPESREKCNQMQLSRFFNKNKLAEKEQVIECISILEKEYPKFKDVFRKYGIAGYGSEYDRIVGNILYDTKLGLTIFDSASKQSTEEIYDILKNKINGWNLAIIDKKLKDGGDGKALATHLYEFCSKENIHFSSVILTSNFEETAKLEPKDYFITEVAKGSEEIEAELISNLAQCAYVSIFNGVKNKSKSAVDDAFKMVLANSNNVVSIIEQSKNEGISSFDAIINSFNLAHSFKFSNNINQSFEHDFLMANSINNDTFSNHFSMLDISADLKDLNCFEIFDYSINEKYSPIENGDVFLINGEYFILLGQPCDLALRGSNKRKLKNAELVKARYKGSVCKDKFVFEFNGKVKTAKINFFKNGTEFGNLTIVLNDISTSDFPILDLCCYNVEGVSKLKFMGVLDANVVKNIAENRSNYFDEIKQLSLNIKDMELPEMVTIHLNDFNLWDFTKTDELISWPIQRICRIKQSYAEALYNEFINHKRRAGLNNFYPAEKLVKLMKIYISYPGKYHESACEINLFESGGESYIKADDLIPQVNGEFNVLEFLNLPEKLTEGICNEFKLDIEDEVLRIEFAFFNIIKGKPIHSVKISSQDLQLKKGIYKNFAGEVIHPNKIVIANIGEGIIVEGENKMIKLDGGKIFIEECQEQKK